MKSTVKKAKLIPFSQEYSRLIKHAFVGYILEDNHVLGNILLIKHFVSVHIGFYFQLFHI